MTQQATITIKMPKDKAQEAFLKAHKRNQALLEKVISRLEKDNRKTSDLTKEDLKKMLAEIKRSSNGEAAQLRNVNNALLDALAKMNKSSSKGGFAPSPS